MGCQHTNTIYFAYSFLFFIFMYPYVEGRECMIIIRAIHHLPRPKDSLEPNALHPITAKSKRWFVRPQVANASTWCYRFKWWFGCLRNQRTQPARWVVLSLLEIWVLVKNPVSPNSYSADIGRSWPNHDTHTQLATLLISPLSTFLFLFSFLFAHFTHTHNRQRELAFT